MDEIQNISVLDIDQNNFEIEMPANNEKVKNLLGRNIYEI